MRRLWIPFCLAVTISLVALAQSSSWIEIDYGPLLDRRQLTHSGESVGTVLRRLAENPNDAVAQQLLDPWLEPYAFVLPDYLAATAPAPPTPGHEVGSSYLPGTPQPAWVELLRARHYILESDGGRRLRAFVPAAPQTDARAAWEQAWPVLRHPIAAALARLDALHSRGTTSLSIEVYAYRHRPERSVFMLDTQPHRVEVLDAAPRGDRPPLDVAAWETFLASGRTLEGGRLAANGTLTLFGSEGRMSLLGRRLTLADAAIAYRAVFHGGLSEPYMSLDRGTAPQHATVNYGGRLRDTSLGLVSLLCDIRFKTFSLGFDPVRGLDARADAKSKAPSFATHVERFFADPRSADAPGQQTRLWFYPDSVDLTVSPQVDLLALRRVRMSAASERAGGGGEVAAWTKATVEGINTDFDKLAATFPELSDLDTVVRLLSLFTWLKAARDEGLLIPDLDVLLAIELPAEPTPRRYPQQLAFGASTPGSATAPMSFDRIDIAVGLDRLGSTEERPLSAARRFSRAIGALDPNVPDQAALAKELQALSNSKDDVTLDDAAFRAERLRMHRLVLGSLSQTARTELKNRADAGETLRVLSLGIGGLDLGMGQVLKRSQRRALTLANGAAPAAALAPAVLRAPATDDWKQAKLPFPLSPLPSVDPSTIESTAIGPRFVYGGDGPSARARVLASSADGGKVFAIERYEEARTVRYAFETKLGALVRTHLTPAPTLEPTPEAVAATPGEGIVTMELFHPPSVQGESQVVRVRLTAVGDKALEASMPRATLQRLLLGRGADLTPARPLSGLAPLPPGLGNVQRVVVWQEAWATRPPWENPHDPLPGEEDPTRVAAALNAWWAAEAATAGLRAVVGTDRAASLTRLATAPRVDKNAALLLPFDAFPGATAAWRESFVAGWNASSVLQSLAKTAPSLVVLVSAESPDALSQRLRHLARDPALKGKALAVVSLMGSLRNDLPAALLREGSLAAIGVATSLPVGIPRWAREVATLGQTLSAPATASRRPEDLPGSLTWYF